MHVLHVVGARPNFMKAAPLMRALSQAGIHQTLIHTGQHYDTNMSSVFFRQLDLPEPQVNLAVGSGSHAQQTAEVMSRLEPLLIERAPDLVLVYGDVNSTLAAALVCSKLRFPVGHVEAGLRSRDRTMPEEINRLLTDQLSELLFTPSADADENLKREGVDPGRIHLVGNVMIDSLVRASSAAADLTPPLEHYALITLHRPSNVDDLAWLRQMLLTLSEISQDLGVLFPVHPRTRQRIAEVGLAGLSNGRLHMVEPAPYLEFLNWQRNSVFVITDSGGIQEETTFLGVPCLTVRENTERPITTSLGTNILVGRDLHRLRAEAQRILRGDIKKHTAIPLWDGHAADRIARIIASSI
jgi:UDP-N-acetylglucosamine 2-epimerase (non-hydrolysing)